MYELPPRLRRRACPLVLALAVLAAALITAGAILDNRALWNSGLIGVSLAPVLLLAYRTQHILDAIERAREDGYDDGFAGGCKAAVRAGLADRPLTLLRTPKQLLDEDDLAGSTDGVSR